VLLKDDIEFTQSKRNVSELLTFIASKLTTNQHNMDFIMPSIAVILALRDRNYNDTMECIQAFTNTERNIVLKLA